MLDFGPRAAAVEASFSVSDDDARKRRCGYAVSGGHYAPVLLRRSVDPVRAV